MEVPLPQFLSHVGDLLLDAYLRIGDWWHIASLTSCSMKKRPPRQQKNVSPRSSNMNWPTNGLVTSSPWIGGRAFGLMRGLLLGCRGIHATVFTQNGKSGRRMSRYSPSTPSLLPYLSVSLGHWLYGLRLMYQDNLQSALRLDGLRSSHPIEVPVKKADEINQMFPPPKQNNYWP